MSRFIIVVIAFMLSLKVHADNGELLARLDSTLSAKPEAIEQKQRNIDFLRKGLARRMDTDETLRLYGELYEEYYVFSYDSATHYLDKGLELARRTKNAYYTQLLTIKKVELLSMAGLYSEAEKLAHNVDCDRLVPALRFDYYITLFDLYRSLADYSYDDTYSPSYRAFAYDCLQKSMRYLPEDEGIRNYYLGDWAKFVKHNPKLTQYYYKRAVKSTREDSRIHARSCYVLAVSYLQSSDEKGKELYEEYLIRAAISDAKCLTMDNLALQKLAILLFQRGNGHIERAQHYILEALGDAKFYNSRLRILEVSQHLPEIIGNYQEALNKRNHNLQLTVVAISILVCGLIALLVIFYKQKKKLAFSQIRQRQAARRLQESYVEQAQLNERLTHLNERLANTNKRRDELSKLFIDLCDKFITRLSKYQTLVLRKIKAGQVQQLLAQTNSSRLSDEDAEVFYHKFDKAFLSLYPSFVEAFNALLRDDAKITPKQDGALTNDMRVYALIRLGVKESSEISNLLFYSPRTVYNYRSQMKNRAINRDTFEEDVRKLCTVI